MSRLRDCVLSFNVRNDFRTARHTRGTQTEYQMGKLLKDYMLVKSITTPCICLLMYNSELLRLLLLSFSVFLSSFLRRSHSKKYTTAPPSLLPSLPNPLILDPNLLQCSQCTYCYFFYTCFIVLPRVRP